MLRKVRIVSLFILIFFISGCSCEYNLTINESTMIESINAIFDKATESDYASQMEKIRRTSFYSFDTRENRYYTFNKRETSNNIILNYTYNYSPNNLYKSEAINRCYYKKIVNVTDNYITIDTDKQVMCLFKDGKREIDDITVNIKTDFIVEDSNADVVNDNIYTWYINETNCNDREIYIKVKKEIPEETSSSSFVYIFIIIAFVCLFAFLVYLIIKKIMAKNNKVS